MREGFTSIVAEEAKVVVLPSVITAEILLSRKDGTMRESNS
jgi:hypothetical protein